MVRTPEGPEQLGCCGMGTGTPITLLCPSFRDSQPCGCFGGVEEEEEEEDPLPGAMSYGPAAISPSQSHPKEGPAAPRSSLEHGASPGAAFSLESAPGAASEQDPSSVPAASSQGRPWLRGSGQGSAFQSKYLSSSTTRGKEQGRSLPRLGARQRLHGAGPGPGRGFGHALTRARAELRRFRTFFCSVGLHKEAFSLHPSKGASLLAGVEKPWAAGPAAGGGAGLQRGRLLLCQRCSKQLRSPGDPKPTPKPVCYPGVVPVLGTAWFPPAQGFFLEMMLELGTEPVQKVRAGSPAPAPTRRAPSSTHGWCHPLVPVPHWSGRGWQPRPPVPEHRGSAPSRCQEQLASSSSSSSSSPGDTSSHGYGVPRRCRAPSTESPRCPAGLVRARASPGLLHNGSCPGPSALLLLSIRGAAAGSAEPALGFPRRIPFLPVTDRYSPRVSPRASAGAVAGSRCPGVPLGAGVPSPGAVALPHHGSHPWCKKGNGKKGFGLFFLSFIVLGSCLLQVQGMEKLLGTTALWFPRGARQWDPHHAHRAGTPRALENTRCVALPYHPAWWS